MSAVRLMLVCILIVFCRSAEGVEGQGLPYVLQWKRLVGEPLAGGVAPGDSAVFFGGVDGRLLALDMRDGTRLWQRRGNGPLGRVPALAEGELFVGDRWGRLLAVDARDGTSLWEAQRLGWGEAEIAVGDSLIYASSADGWLYAFRRIDGSQAWRVRIGARAASRPCLDGKRLYVGTRDGHLLAVDAASGRRLESADAGGRPTAPLLLTERRLVVATDDGYVDGYGPRRLDLRWARRLGSRVLPEILRVGKMLICAAQSGWAYGLSLKDGRLMWKRDLGGEPAGGATLGPQGEAILGTVDGRLLALGVGKGELLWEVQLLERGGVRPCGRGKWLYASAEDGYLYAFTEPAPLQRGGASLWEDWWEVFSFDRKTGYRHRVAHRERLNEMDAVRLVEESVEWRGGFHRSLSQVWLDADFVPLAFAHRTVEGSQVIEMEGVWSGDSLRVEKRLGENVLAWRVAVGPGVVLPEALFLRLRSEGRVAAGRRDSVMLFDYSHLGPRLLYLAFGEREEEGMEVRMRYADPLFDGVEILTRIDDRGREVREEVPALETAQMRTSEEEARAWVPPGEGKRLWLDYPVADPVSTEELVLGLPTELGDVRRLVVEDERQQLAAEPGGGARLTVRRVAYDGEGAAQLPIRDPEMAPYLQSTFYVQADDPRIVALARRLRGGEKDSWKVAVRLRQWVYDHMIPRDTNVRFKSTLEVLEDMEGTCSEYAVLFMALCRAAGVPVRASVGFLASPGGEMVLHIWSQVYVGRWVDVDASWSGDAVSAAHVKTGQGRLTAAEMQGLNLPLRLFLVRADTLELREYRDANGRFIGAAEALFSQAREAERSFQDERAQELYHRLTLLPWNRRSGAAHIEIARYRLRREEPDEAAWACERILRFAAEGSAADDALFYLSRVAEARGDTAAGMALLERLITQMPDHDLADDALGRLGELHERRQGCASAIPYYEMLQEKYSQSGWASVARSALVRCRRALQAGTDGP